MGKTKIAIRQGLVEPDSYSEGCSHLGDNVGIQKTRNVIEDWTALEDRLTRGINIRVNPIIESTQQAVEELELDFVGVTPPKGAKAIEGVTQEQAQLFHERLKTLFESIRNEFVGADIQWKRIENKIHVSCVISDDAVNRFSAIIGVISVIKQLSGISKKSEGTIRDLEMAILNLENRKIEYDYDDNLTSKKEREKAYLEKGIKDNESNMETRKLRHDGLLGLYREVIDSSDDEIYAKSQKIARYLQDNGWPQRKSPEKLSNPENLRAILCEVFQLNEKKSDKTLRREVKIEMLRKGLMKLPQVVLVLIALGVGAFFLTREEKEEVKSKEHPSTRRYKSKGLSIKEYCDLLALNNPEETDEDGSPIVTLPSRGEEVKIKWYTVPPNSSKQTALKIFYYNVERYISGKMTTKFKTHGLSEVHTLRQEPLFVMDNYMANGRVAKVAVWFVSTKDDIKKSRIVKVRRRDGSLNIMSQVLVHRTMEVDVYVQGAIEASAKRSITVQTWYLDPIDGQTIFESVEPSIPEDETNIIDATEIPNSSMSVDSTDAELEDSTEIE